MALDSTVEVKASFMIDETDGYGIWIIVIPQQCEGARGSPFKNSDALLLRKLLPMSAHGSEIAHDGVALAHNKILLPVGGSKTILATPSKAMQRYAFFQKSRMPSVIIRKISD